LLADRSNPDHMADLQRMDIEPFDLLVVNLYPFGSDPSIELIDVGGPTMVRAAAKNHAHVAVVVNPEDYVPTLDALRAGSLDLVARRRLARRAFAHTAAYDAAIVAWFDADDGDVLPETLHLTLERAETLRYGENPHQLGARYRLASGRSWWDAAELVQGKPLSYLNVFDADAAWRLVQRFDSAAAVVVKHANPCGVATGSSMLDAYQRAHACDPLSAFGGIVAMNRPVDADTARALTEVFTEVLVAPAIDEDARALLAAKPALRVLVAGQPAGNPLELRSIDAGVLVQEPDPVAFDRAACTVPTRVQPTEAQWAELAFAWQVCAAVSSNAIVLTGDTKAVGIGAGQQNRMDSARIAVEKAAGRAVGGVAASDAFFPFRDGLDVVAGAGISAVIQPGGSIRDAEVIDACDEHGIAMVFTGQRHFRH
jgi:phosphoribosylaminoimidazolecarboxamide formyltransferase / IMP cyclohydrolase